MFLILDTRDSVPGAPAHILLTSPVLLAVHVLTENIFSLLFTVCSVLGDLFGLFGCFWSLLAEIFTIVMHGIG